jgi:hypothetical protein
MKLMETTSLKEEYYWIPSHILKLIHISGDSLYNQNSEQPDSFFVNTELQSKFEISVRWRKTGMQNPQQVVTVRVMQVQGISL